MSILRPFSLVHGRWRWPVKCKRTRGWLRSFWASPRRVVRHRPGVLIVEHKLGFVVADAGVDQSER